MSDDKNNTQLDIERAYSKLTSGDEAGSKDIFHKYIPCMGHIDFHYALYSLEEAVYFSDEFLNPKKYQHGTSYARIMRAEMKKAHKQNPIETYKLLSWSKTHEVSTHDKVRNSDSGMDLLRTALERGVHNDKRTVYKQALDAYKDKFELETYIVFLANLLLIQKGQDFEEAPFKSFKLAINNKLIHDGKYMKKGLAVSWLRDNSAGRLKQLLNLSYITPIRNLSGHHSYTVSTRYRRFETETGNYSLKEVFKRLHLLTRLHVSISLGASLALFEYDPDLGSHLTNFGIKDWVYNHENKTLTIPQFFGNFDPTQKHKTIGFYTPPVKGKGNIVSIHFDDNRVYPYDLRVIAGKGTLGMLERLKLESKVKVVIISIAPEIEPFTRLDGFPRIDVMGIPMVAIDSHEMTLKVDNAAIEKVVEVLKDLPLS